MRTTSNGKELDVLLVNLRDFQSVTKTLQRDSATIAEAHLFLDSVLSKFLKQSANISRDAEINQIHSLSPPWARWFNRTCINSYLRVSGIFCLHRQIGKGQ